VLGGSAKGALRAVETHPRSGFETAITLAGHPQRLAVRGLDARGRPLAVSPTLEL
jgi:hypothetical protein